MRRFLTASLLALCCLLQGCISRPRLTIQFSGLGPSQTNHRNAPQNALVEELAGKAELKRVGDTEWNPLAVGDIIPVGAKVRTEADSSLVIGIPGNGSRVMMDESSVLELQRLEAPVVGDPSALLVRIQVFQGNVSGSFRSAQAASVFEIVNPSGEVTYYSPGPMQGLTVSYSSPNPLTVDLSPAFLDPAVIGMHPNFMVAQLGQVPEPGIAMLAVFGGALLLGALRCRVRR